MTQLLDANKTRVTKIKKASKKTKFSYKNSKKINRNE